MTREGAYALRRHRPSPLIEQAELSSRSVVTDAVGSLDAARILLLDHHFDPHPLFAGVVEAAVKQSRLV